MIKCNLYFLLVLVVTSIFFTSCKTSGLIEKRRYSKGYFIGLKKHPAKPELISINSKISAVDINEGKPSVVLEEPAINQKNELSLHLYTKQLIVDSFTTIVKSKPIVKVKSSLKTTKQIKSSAKVKGKLLKKYGNTLDDYFAWLIVILLAALYCLLVYGWMLLLAGILLISIVPVIPVGIVVFGILMAGLTLFGAYYLFNFDKGDKLKWWQVLLITELLIPAIVALIVGLLYLSTIK